MLQRSNRYGVVTLLQRGAGGVFMEDTLSTRNITTMLSRTVVHNTERTRMAIVFLKVETTVGYYSLQRSDTFYYS